MIILGATEAGAAAAFHLGESALLLEQETQVTSIDVYGHCLEVASGASFIYDKLVSTLRTGELFPLIMDQMPSRIQSVKSLRQWLNSRDVELLDTASQLIVGDVDAQAAGKRVADSIQREMALKYSAAKGLFQPRLVSAWASQAPEPHSAAPA